MSRESAVYLLHGWCHVKLLSSRRKFCAYHTIVHHFTVSLHSKPHSRVYMCLAVTCHLHFWQNDRDLLRAIEVNEGWGRGGEGRGRYRNDREHSKLTLEKKIFPPLLPELGTQTFDHESLALPLSHSCFQRARLCVCV